MAIERPAPKVAAGRVLLASGNAEMRADLERLLTEQGYAVEAVADGEAALAAVRREPPAIILWDVMMPKVDGFGLLAAHRSDAVLRETPVVLLSAGAGERARIEGLEAGADDYFVNPLVAHELIARVGSNLRLARERREAALKANEARLLAINADLERQIIERSHERGRMWQVSPDLLSVIDLDTATFDRVNPAWSETLGWSIEEIEGASYEAFVHPDDLAASAAAFEEVRRGRPLLRFENRYRHKKGGWRWLSWVAVPEGAKLYSDTRDITSEKEAAAELERTQEQLRQAQKMEAVGQLTGGIAHDFNNLLQGVVGSLDLIQRRPHDPERIRRWAEAGLEAAMRAARLTKQLLAFSRTQKLELCPVPLSELVSGFRELLDRVIGPSIHVKLALTTGGVHVLGDKTQLETAILNLAINARDAMPNGGELTISSALRQISGDPELPSGRYVELAVADTGQGMPPEVVARAFDPFFTTKAAGAGTGLGLSQVYGAVHQAGGAVRIESQPGAGTTVRLLLKQADPGAAPTVGHPEAPASGPAPIVLVVDDDPDARHSLIDYLDALGCTALEAEDGYAGIAALEQSGPDALILDFAMPGMNGAEVARQVRARRPNLPIIFATGFSESSAIEAAAGKDATVLRKPIRVEELQAVLSAALSNRI